MHRNLCGRILSLLLVLCLLTGCSIERKERIGEDMAGPDYSNAVRVIDINLTEENYGIGVDKERPDLLLAVNRFIREIRENGEYDEIMNHFFGDGTPHQVAGVPKDSGRDQLIVAIALDFEPFEYGTWDEMYGIDLELAEAFAEYLGKDVDQPRNLAKSVTVE